MKKSLVALMACAAMSAASVSIAASSQAPPGIHAATSNKVEGVKEVNNQQPVSGAIAAAEGKTFVLTAVGLGTPMVWRPAADKIQPPPLLVAVGFDKNYIGLARLPATSLGEPPGGAIFFI